ncbi:WASH complex subunit 3 [Daktulosphaira vitifoliae]|uniref:WASH complex subunit 3 n=1 Tax=Daktulosphaira vitifoliae TaxID=58002 RepID=UPI0021AA93A6|nr:WASH complex subunit 3 [Daktulosphaira vitifoliae]
MEFENAPTLEERQLVTFINHFIITSVTFLNNFMVHCDSKLMEVEQRLQKVAATLCILETKLNSIPDLREIEEKQTYHSNETIKTEINENLKIEEKENSLKKEETLLDKNNFSDNSEEKVSTSDPVILKYRKMLHVGVPRGAVELKMLQSGLDPKCL